MSLHSSQQLIKMLMNAMLTYVTVPRQRGGCRLPLLSLLNYSPTDSPLTT
ncbi:hypothetical protein Anas_08016 [Armadillidium nasatum]|uniref:Uncharacterized protein n=1 Tax=Armadillidium nasatum TaxID=96803 RepID=A0A5N5SV64_9CRUS|nr:hypothetical protein Anas_08016 [Armadillidium nasatum]